MTELTQFIINCLSVYYWIEVTALALFPVGAYLNTSIYKVEASDQKTNFVKLKRCYFHEANIAILELLQMVGIQQLIPPIKTVEVSKSNRLAISLSLSILLSRGKMDLAVLSLKRGELLWDEP